MLFALKNATGLCKHVAGGKPTSAAAPGNGQQELCRLANAAMLPAALPGGGNCWLPSVPAGAAAWKCPLLQPEVGPGKFSSTKQENDTNATSP